MTVAIDIPLGKSREGELLDMLENLIGEASSEAHDSRVEALSELSSRGKLVDGNRAFATFVLAAKKHGLSKPEGQLLSQLLRNMCEEDNVLLDRLLSELENEQDGSHFVPCATRALRGLSHGKRRASLRPLVNALARQRSTDSTTDYLMEALVSMEDSKFKSEASSLISPLLLRANPTQVLLATRIISRIGTQNQFDTMLKVLERTMEEWYDGQAAAIQSEALGYFRRCPGEPAVPLLARLIRTSSNNEVAKTLASFRHHSTALALMELVEDSISGDLKWEQLRLSMVALDELDPALIDLETLTSHSRLYEVPEASYRLTSIMVRAGPRAKPILVRLLKTQNRNQYSFATECLAKMGFTPDEMAEVFGESPAASIYRFFYPDETAEKIWSDRDPGKLGGTVRLSLKRFDHLLVSILTSFSFSVIYVDPANKKGVDLVALSPSTPHMIVAGATVGALKDDARNLSATLTKMRDELRDVMERYVTFPVIFTAEPVTPDDIKSSAQAGVIVLGPDHIRQVITMSRTGRTGSDLIRLLASRKDEMARTLWT